MIVVKRDNKIFIGDHKIDIPEDVLTWNINTHYLTFAFIDKICVYVITGYKTIIIPYENYTVNTRLVQKIINDNTGIKNVFYHYRERNIVCFYEENIMTINSDNFSREIFERKLPISNTPNITTYVYHNDLQRLLDHEFIQKWGHSKYDHKYAFDIISDKGDYSLLYNHKSYYIANNYYDDAIYNIRIPDFNPDLLEEIINEDCILYDNNYYLRELTTNFNPNFVKLSDCESPYFINSYYMQIKSARNI